MNIPRSAAIVSGSRGGCGQKEHRPAAVANTQEGVAISAVQDGALFELSIRDMLRGVKDDNGKPSHIIDKYTSYTW